ncbi:MULTISPECIES: hypothetical protein [Niastella]|uniref:Uncharacterized protein n=1 Tax=Niastella soli TaxID=2821487 RepID=A0ABS3YQN2_9BACT|nr:hypothetical protein [Niastella soli]MBO9200219.1 hypothetical protein [Niastella soli]
MDYYLLSLKHLVNEFLETEDKESIQFISINFNTEPAPFKGWFVISEAQKIVIPSNMTSELVILITFTYLTPGGKKLEALMSTNKALDKFDHRLEGKSSTYVMKTGNDVELIESTIQEIVENIFPSVSKQEIQVSMHRTGGILGYLTDPG